MVQRSYTEYEKEEADNGTPGSTSIMRFPEGTFSGARVNDSFRAMASTIRNLGDSAFRAPVDEGGNVVSAQAGTLSLQDADDVNITGGILTAVRGSAPVGSLILWWGDFASYVENYAALLAMGWVIADGRTVTNPYTNASVTAPNFIGRHLRFGSSDARSVFGTDVQATSSSGTHAHGGDTAPESLTDAQMPSSVLMDIAITGTGGAAGAGTSQIVRTRSGLNQGHSHGIASDGAHTHTVTVTPASIRLIPLARMF